MIGQAKIRGWRALARGELDLPSRVPLELPEHVGYPIAEGEGRLEEPHEPERARDVARIRRQRQRVDPRAATGATVGPRERARDAPSPRRGSGVRARWWKASVARPRRSASRIGAVVADGSSPPPRAAARCRRCGGRPVCQNAASEKRSSPPWSGRWQKSRATKVTTALVTAAFEEGARRRRPGRRAVARAGRSAPRRRDASWRGAACPDRRRGDRGRRTWCGGSCPRARVRGSRRSGRRCGWPRHAAGLGCAAA